MLRLLLYPTIPSESPYINKLHDILKEITYIKNNPSKKRWNYFECYSNLFKSDVFYFNWIENVPNKNPALLHFILVYGLLVLLKLFNKKILWTYHNISSHSGGDFYVKKIMNWLMNHADLIFIHSKESLFFLQDKKRASEVRYFFHPIHEHTTKISLEKTEKEYDILIWGTMFRYKGVLEFLEYMKKTESMSQWKIKIVGRFPDVIYKQQVMQYSSPFVRIEDRFVSDDEIKYLHQQSRYVLFPYNGKCVLNSGALADSLCYDSIIIGPNRGAFKDLHEENIILVYNDFSDLNTILEEGIIPDNKAKEEFKRQYSWDNFKYFLQKELERLELKAANNKP